MSERIIDIANRFLAEKPCTHQELVEFKKWLSSLSSRLEVEEWLLENWVTSSEVDSETLIESIFKQIQEYNRTHYISSGTTIRQIIRIYQKIAAFLLIPLLGVGIWVGLNLLNVSSVRYAETIAPRGQKSQIVLSDGTKVWLNSDTKIRYPGNFSKNQRDVYLDGEAFFEVTKNAHHPFVVHASGIDVKVLGTKFDVKAYPDEDQVETSLFEGRVDLVSEHPESSGFRDKEMHPGQSFVFSKENHKLYLDRFQRDEINGWRKNQLIFKDDTFSNLVRKMERWYDVKVVYDEKLFNDRHLTVELYEGERLERLLEIIGLALSVDYKYEKGTIILTPKAKNMKKK